MKMGNVNSRDEKEHTTDELTKTKGGDRDKDSGSVQNHPLIQYPLLSVQRINVLNSELISKIKKTLLDTTWIALVICLVRVV